MHFGEEAYNVNGISTYAVNNGVELIFFRITCTFDTYFRTWITQSSGVLPFTGMPRIWKKNNKKQKQYKHKGKRKEKSKMNSNTKTGSEIIILLVLLQGVDSVYHFLDIVLNHVLYLTTMDALYALVVCLITLFI